MDIEVSVWAALAAGVVSFISPCVLPLVPAYISFMTGISVDDMRNTESVDRKKVMLKAGMHSLSFVLGFSLVFILLGASATLLGRMLLNYMDLLSKVGGVLIVIFGLHFMGLFRIGFLNYEARFNPDKKPPGLLGSMLIGIAFAFGWTPCVGPILAAILSFAGAQESVGHGILLLAAYSLGLGIPFILAGVATNHFFTFFTRIRSHLHKVEVVSGILLVIVGVMIFSGSFTQLAVFLLEWFPALAEIG